MDFAPYIASETNGSVLPDWSCGVRGTALIIGDYRYLLGRWWGDGGLLGIVMLNPSTANERIPDPTIRRCVNFATSWGFGRILVANAYAFRSAFPSDLGRAYDPVGPLNDEALAFLAANVDHMLVAWGAYKIPKARIEQIARILGPNLSCLGVTQSGAPKHPLYLRRDTARRPWRPLMPEAARS